MTTTIITPPRTNIRFSDILDDEANNTLTNHLFNVDSKIESLKNDIIECNLKIDSLVIPPEQVQSDFSTTSTSDKSYIKNKPKRYLIDKYQLADGTSERPTRIWYRRYNDGWVEEGGLLVVDSNGVAVSFTNTLSVVYGFFHNTFNQRLDSTSDRNWLSVVKNVTGTGATLYAFDADTSSSIESLVCWSVCGFK